MPRSDVFYEEEPICLFVLPSRVWESMRLCSILGVKVVDYAFLGVPRLTDCIIRLAFATKFLE